MRDDKNGTVHIAIEPYKFRVDNYLVGRHELDGKYGNISVAKFVFLKEVV